VNSRFVERIYARVNGYFWLPCPLCQREFGGHEWLSGPQYGIPWPEEGTNHGRGICPRCGDERAEAARKRGWSGMFSLIWLDSERRWSEEELLRGEDLLEADRRMRDAGFLPLDEPDEVDN
jgi:hypothetical protein